ncbi:MAG: HNH endonuclease, partial [Planctomycetaceae bacterium]
GILIPKTVTVVRKVRLRSTLLAADLKQRYLHSCQICNGTVQLVSTQYAEAHHIRPLGSPHFGPDVEGNILVVCPNHHVMLDRGAVSIDPHSLLVRHIRQAFEPCRLNVAPWHNLDHRFLLYHGAHIFGS